MIRMYCLLLSTLTVDYILFALLVYYNGLMLLAVVQCVKYHLRVSYIMYVEWTAMIR